MMKKNVRYLMAAFITVTVLCGLNGCSGSDDQEVDDRIIIETEEEQSAVREEQPAAEAEEEQIVEGNGIEEVSETKITLDQENSAVENAASGEDLDVVVPDPADDDWYLKGNIYTDDKGNRLEVFFDDYGMLQFAVNGLVLYYSTVDNFQQENNWKVYTCDDGTMIGYYPGEPAHIEICDGDYAGIYEAGGDKVR